jgi:hypothetical protein
VPFATASAGSKVSAQKATILEVSIRPCAVAHGEHTCLEFPVFHHPARELARAFPMRDTIAPMASVIKVSACVYGKAASWHRKIGWL